MKKLSELPVLSIRQPWAWMILHAGKDVENRSWHCSHRGPFLIHASKGCTRKEYNDAIDFAFWDIGIFSAEFRSGVPLLSELPRGGIVGMAEITDCVTCSDSPWFFGKYGFVIKNPVPLRFFPCRGSLGFFKLPYQ